MKYIQTKYLLISLALHILQILIGNFEVPLYLRIVLGLSSLFFAWKACSLKNGSNHPMPLYIIVSGIYVFAAQFDVSFASNKMNLDPKLMGDLTDLGVSFLICSAFGFIFYQPKQKFILTSAFADRQTSNIYIYVSFALFIVCAILTVQYYGLSIGGLSRSEIYSDYSTVLIFFRSLLVMSFGVGAAVIKAYEKSIGINYKFGRFCLILTLFLYCLLDLLILGDRRLPLTALLIVGIILLPERYNKKQIITAVTFSIILFLYGFVRNTPIENWLPIILSGEIFEAFSPASTEFGGLAIIGSTIVNFDGSLYGYPYYGDAFFQIIPKFITENRPLSPTEWFIQYYYPDLAALGASYAYNQVIEALINAGKLGVILVGFLTGYIISFISSIKFKDVKIGLAIAPYIFLFSMRMDFASILKMSFIAFGSTFFLLTFAIVTKFRR